MGVEGIYIAMSLTLMDEDMTLLGIEICVDVYYSVCKAEMFRKCMLWDDLGSC